MISNPSSWRDNDFSSPKSIILTTLDLLILNLFTISPSNLINHFHPSLSLSFSSLMSDSSRPWWFKWKVKAWEWTVHIAPPQSLVHESERAWDYSARTTQSELTTFFTGHRWESFSKAVLHLKSNFEKRERKKNNKKKKTLKTSHQEQTVGFSIWVTCCCNQIGHK